MRLAWPAALVAEFAAAFAAAETPEPAPAPYVPPLTILDTRLELPRGPAPTKNAVGDVCYAPDTHLRLTMALALAEPLSDTRARLSWIAGWGSAREAGDGEFEAEHRSRLEAEANARLLRLEVDAIRAGERWWVTVGERLGYVAAGAVVGWWVTR